MNAKQLNALCKTALRRNYTGFPATFDELFKSFDNWVPKVDILENSEAFVFRFELPGVNADDVEISVEKDRLLVKGKKAKAESQEGESYHMSERSYGEFERSFRFESAIDADAVSAESKDGILTLRVQKAEEAKPRRIEVKLG